MIVSALPIWIVFLIALAITLIYYLRNKKYWMGNFLVVLFVFSINFLFFAWGLLFFILGEIIRKKYKKNL